MKSKNQDEIKQIIIMSISENQSILRNAIHEVDNPALSAVVCTPDYFKSLTQGCKESLQIVPNLSYSNPTQLISMSNRIAHTYAMYIIHGRATSNKSPDILFGESSYTKQWLMQKMIPHKFFDSNFSIHILLQDKFLERHPSLLCWSTH